MAIEKLLKNNRQGGITIDSATTVEKAVWILRKADTSALIVTDDGHDILGLVSARDLIRALKTHGVDPLMPMTVADIMQRNVLTCRPDESLRRAMSRITARRLSHVVVMGDSGPRGVVSLADIIKARLQWAREEIETAYKSFTLIG